MNTEGVDRPRVLHFIWSSVRAGAEEHALSILAALPDYGMKPYFAAPERLLSAMRPELAQAQIEAFPLDISSLMDLRAVSRLVRLLRRERISLVHSHLFISSLFASPVARLAGVPAVIETFHGREVWREGKPLKGSFWIDRQVARLVDLYIAVSHACARDLREKKKIPAEKIRVIHNGRDLSLYVTADPALRNEARAELGLADEQRAILVLGRLETQKGHIFLIQALADLVSRWPRVIALFAGSGSLEGELRARVEALGLSRHVAFLGYRNDAPRLFAAADMVVLPSLHEGLPLVAIEALAAARPMVATAVDGTPEVIIDEQTGLLVPPGDPGAMASAVERLLRYPDLGAKLACAGHAHVMQRFDIRMQLERTVEVYREVMRGQSA
jgi:glycosyltransferase involved in cell wall biosynthesis